jgi:hypothetical protein
VFSLSDPMTLDVFLPDTRSPARSLTPCTWPSRRSARPNCA